MQAAEKPASVLRVSHTIATTVEGPLGAALAYTLPPLPELSEVLGTLATLALVATLTPELRDNATAQKAAARAHAILEAFGAAE